MQTKIQRWGNSLGLRIPKSLAEEVHVEAGSVVDISVKDGHLAVKPVRRRKYELRDLLRKVNFANIHKEVRTGDAVGREVW